MKPSNTSTAQSVAPSIDVDSLMKRMTLIEDELQNKVDQDIYDNEIASIGSMIGNIDYDQKPATQLATSVMVQPSLPFSNKEIAEIKSMIERMP